MSVRVSEYANGRVSVRVGEWSEVHASGHAVRVAVQVAVRVCLCACGKVDELARAVRRRILIKYGVERHPFRDRRCGRPICGATIQERKPGFGWEKSYYYG